MADLALSGVTQRGGDGRRLQQHPCGAAVDSLPAVTRDALTTIPAVYFLTGIYNQNGAKGDGPDRQDEPDRRGQTGPVPDMGGGMTRRTRQNASSIGRAGARRREGSGQGGGMCCKDGSSRAGLDGSGLTGSGTNRSDRTGRVAGAGPGAPERNRRTAIRHQRAECSALSAGW